MNRQARERIGALMGKGDTWWPRFAGTRGVEARGRRARAIDVIVGFENQCVRAARAATSSIPIVFVQIYDPQSAGYIKSLARPGGNLTGPVANLKLIDKRLKLLRQMDPKLQRILVLFDGRDPYGRRGRARTRGGHGAEAATGGARCEKRSGFASIVRSAEAYSTDADTAGPVAARYVDKTFKGANPAELPVEELSTTVLAINVKRSQELSLSIPSDIRLRATKVVE